MTGHLLLIEDDLTIGEVLASSLRVHGHEVVWERLGEKGLAQASVTPFDLVILDLGLPDIDGIEVCRQLRHAQPACVIVMLTARSAEMDVVVGLEAGADDYLFQAGPAQRTACPCSCAFAPQRGAGSICATRG